MRALRAGARIEYDPTLTVTHAVKRYTPDELRTVGLRDGASVGWILRRHGYGHARRSARMLVRPLGGSGVALAAQETSRAPRSTRRRFGAGSEATCGARRPEARGSAKSAA